MAKIEAITTRPEQDPCRVIVVPLQSATADPVTARYAWAKPESITIGSERAGKGADQLGHPTGGTFLRGQPASRRAILEHRRSNRLNSSRVVPRMDAL